MDESFFNVKIEPSARGEYETPDVWMKLIHEQGKKIKIVESSYWFPVNDKPQLDAAEAKLKELFTLSGVEGGGGASKAQ